MSKPKTGGLVWRRLDPPRRYPLGTLEGHRIEVERHSARSVTFVLTCPRGPIVRSNILRLVRRAAEMAR